VKKKKDFDCVEMKWNIQRDLLREEQELGLEEAEEAEEAKKRRRERVLNDPVLAPFLTKLTDKSRGGRRVA
jgi:hypothetical protein